MKAALTLAFTLVATTASAQQPVWSSVPCGRDLTAAGIVCGPRVLPCTPLWREDVAGFTGLELAARCETAGDTRYVLLSADGHVLVDSGNVVGSQTSFRPLDIVPGGYPEISLTYTLGDFHMTAITYFDAITGRIRIVYTGTGPWMEASVGGSEGTTIRDCNYDYRWNANSRNFVVAESVYPRDSVCDYE